MNRWIKNVCRVACLGIIVVCVFIRVWNRKDQSNRESHMDQTHMTERIDRKTLACGQLVNNTPVNAIKQKQTLKPVTQTVYAENYNLAYCKVGKAGGTFIKHMISVLINDVNKSMELEHTARWNVHANVNRQLAVNFQRIDIKNARLITVGRNPYSRLYSAYIDRVSVPATSPPIREGSQCRLDVTFEEFLTTVVKNTEHGKMDVHWSPIYYICRPCDVTSTFIVKQETFTDDILFVVDKLRLPDRKRKAILRKLKESRITWTITGVVKEQMTIAKKLLTNPACIGWFGVIKRMWKAFQIQGYIDDNVDLPIELYNETNDFSNNDLFLKTAFKTIDKHPMSSEAMQKQRQKALVHAYRDVDKNIIEDIKRIFKPDFDMFGYSDEPPV